MKSQRNKQGISNIATFHPFAVTLAITYDQLAIPASHQRLGGNNLMITSRTTNIQFISVHFVRGITGEMIYDKQNGIIICPGIMCNMSVFLVMKQNLTCNKGKNNWSIKFLPQLIKTRNTEQILFNTKRQYAGPGVRTEFFHSISPLHFPKHKHFYIYMFITQNSLVYILQASGLQQNGQDCITARAAT